MQTHCISKQIEFEGFDSHKVVAGFDGGAITSDAGALLLRHADKAIGLFDRVASCLVDHRKPEITVHSVRTLVAQRISAIALRYEDVDDHDTLRHDPVLALLSECLRPILLSSSLHFLRSRSSGCQTAAFRHRRQQGIARGGNGPTGSHIPVNRKSDGTRN